MEAKIVGGAIGSVGQYDVSFKEGKLVAELKAHEAFFEGGMVVKIDAGQVLDALAAAIPGAIDDAVIALVKAALIK